MATTHPILIELIEACKKNGLNESKAYLAYECYAELCEVRKLWDVKCEFRKELRIFYLTGRNKKDGPFEVFVPVLTSDTLSPEEIESLQNGISPDQKQITVMIKDRDSSTTYYRLSQGLIRPDSPRTMARKKEEESNKKQIETEIMKNKKLMFSKASATKSALNDT